MYVGVRQTTKRHNNKEKQNNKHKLHKVKKGRGGIGDCGQQFEVREHQDTTQFHQDLHIHH